MERTSRYTLLVHLPRLEGHGTSSTGQEEDLELATLGWVHRFSHNRLHSAPGHVPPVEYEEQHTV